MSVGQSALLRYAVLLVSKLLQATYVFLKHANYRGTLVLKNKRRGGPVYFEHPSVLLFCFEMSVFKDINVCLFLINKWRWISLDEMQYFVSWFARCCTSVLDFHSKNLQITSKLLTQGYRYHKLRKSFGKFFRSYSELLSKFGDISFQEYL